MKAKELARLEDVERAGQARCEDADAFGLRLQAIEEKLDRAIDDGGTNAVNVGTAAAMLAVIRDNMHILSQRLLVSSDSERLIISAAAASLVIDIDALAANRRPRPTPKDAPLDPRAG